MEVRTSPPSSAEAPDIPVQQSGDPPPAPPEHHPQADEPPRSPSPDAASPLPKRARRESAVLGRDYIRRQFELTKRGSTWGALESLRDGDNGASKSDSIDIKSEPADPSDASPVWYGVGRNGRLLGSEFDADGVSLHPVEARGPTSPSGYDRVGMRHRSATVIVRGPVAGRGRGRGRGGSVARNVGFAPQPAAEARQEEQEEQEDMSVPEELRTARRAMKEKVIERMREVTSRRDDKLRELFFMEQSGNVLLLDPAALTRDTAEPLLRYISSKRLPVPRLASTTADASAAPTAEQQPQGSDAVQASPAAASAPGAIGSPAIALGSAAPAPFSRKRFGGELRDLLQSFVVLGEDDAAQLAPDTVAMMARRDAWVQVELSKRPRLLRTSDVGAAFRDAPPTAVSFRVQQLQDVVALAGIMAKVREQRDATRKKIGKAILKRQREIDTKALEVQRNLERARRTGAHDVARLVRHFWNSARKIVRWQLDREQQERQRLEHGRQLDALVNQTEKYSNMLASKLGTDTAETDQPSEQPSKTPAPKSEISAPTTKISAQPSENVQPSDNAQTSTATSGDQPMAEQPMESSTPTRARRTAALNNRLIAAAVAPSTQPSDAAAPPADADDEYVGNPEDESEEERDDDSFAEAEALEERQEDGEGAINLEDEANLPIEEIMRRYYGGGEAEEEEEEEEEEGKSENASQAATEETAGDRSVIDEDEDEEEDADGERDEEEDDDDDGESTEDESLAAQLNSAAEPAPSLDEATSIGVSLQPTGHTLSTTSISTKIPFLIKHPLREYQIVGLNWLVTMHDRRLNGILADEMGLGKTIQTIALLAHLACEKGLWGPHLIVVPSSVILNWEMEFKRWCPAFKVISYYGALKERKELRVGWTKENAFHVCITSYKLVMQDQHIFRRKAWHYLILDEAHNIKNFKSMRWQSMLNFNTQHRLLLTGTPLQNSLMELWSYMHFLMPDVFVSHKEFQEWFSNPLTSMVEGGDRVNYALVQRLHTVLRPFLLRRLKKDVEQQLPSKYEHVVMTRLSRRQRFLYDDFMSRSGTQAMLSSGNFMSVLSCLMQLRKVCAHPDLFEPRPIVSPLRTAALDITQPRLAYVDELHDTARPILSVPQPHSQRWTHALRLPERDIHGAPTAWQAHDALLPVIERFVAVIPGVVCPPPMLTTVRPLPASSSRAIEEASGAVLPLVADPRGDPMHTTRVRMSMQFPDRRLVQFDCGKLQTLHGLLRTLYAGGHRALIFTQMTRMLDILEDFLSLHGHRYVRLDGATNVERRQLLVERFNQDNRIFVFILSTRSGGIGLNLTGADTVIFYDSDWNPAMDAQAQDRCHRIGQTRDVHVYRLVTEHTIEENVLRKAEQKRRLDDMVITEGIFTTDSLTGMLDAATESADSSKLDNALAQIEDADDVAAYRRARQEAAEYVSDTYDGDNPLEAAQQAQQQQATQTTTAPAAEKAAAKESDEWAIDEDVIASIKPVEAYALRLLVTVGIDVNVPAVRSRKAGSGVVYKPASPSPAIPRAGKKGELLKPKPSTDDAAGRAGTEPPAADLVDDHTEAAEGSPEASREATPAPLVL